MSKKDFIALADVIRDIERNEFWGLSEAENEGRKIAMATVIEKLADFCQSQNPRFMRGRWLAYIGGECGKNGGKIKAA